MFGGVRRPGIPRYVRLSSGNKKIEDDSFNIQTINGEGESRRYISSFYRLLLTGSCSRSSHQVDPFPSLPTVLTRSPLLSTASHHIMEELWSPIVNPVGTEQKNPTHHQAVFTIPKPLPVPSRLIIRSPRPAPHRSLRVRNRLKVSLQVMASLTGQLCLYPHPTLLPCEFFVHH